MDNENKILNHPRPLEGIETGTECGIPCPGIPAVNRSRGERVIRTTDSQRCRECVGALAHRMAQPMTALRGGIELGLMGKRTVADYRALLEQSLLLADTMVQMIVSLRELGESGAPGGARESVSLPAALNEILAEMEGLAQSRDLRLELSAEAETLVDADPQGLRDALQNLLAWVIQNCACGGAITVKTSVAEGRARVHISPPRLDLQYLQIKMLDDIASPGLLFSHATQHGALGWAINQRLLDGLGGKLEMQPEGPAAGGISVILPLAPTG